MGSWKGMCAYSSTTAGRKRYYGHISDHVRLIGRFCTNVRRIVLLRMVFQSKFSTENHLEWTLRRFRKDQPPMAFPSLQTVTLVVSEVLAADFFSPQHLSLMGVCSVARSPDFPVAAATDAPTVDRCARESVSAPFGFIGVARLGGQVCLSLAGYPPPVGTVYDYPLPVRVGSKVMPIGVDWSEYRFPLFFPLQKLVHSRRALSLEF